MGKLTALLIASALAAGERLAVPGGEVVYETAGRGEAVVFLHGAFMDRSSWDQQFAAFAGQFRVVRYDIRPFGESSRPDQPYSVPDDLLRLLEHLGIARAHLVGHSFGGAVAVDFALLHPSRVASLILASASPNGFMPPDDERKRTAGIFAAVKDGDDAIIRAWLQHPMWGASQRRPAVIKAVEASTRRSLGAFRMTFAPYVSLSPPALGRLGEIRVPTLVVVGDQDTPGNRQASDVLAKQIPGAALRVIAGADHALPLGWAEEFNAAALGFMAAARR